MGKYLEEGWVGGNDKTSGMFQLWAEFTALLVTILEEKKQHNQ
jgi:hypothetical protein